MDDIAIKIDNLSKKYKINVCPSNSEGYYTLRDVISRKLKNLIRSSLVAKSNLSMPDSNQDFWALEGLNVEIKRGERVGIIGRNGAGKSTLLKILSRITEPTKGRIEIRGRIASLLEVGTGFHPELTGRENIYMNGAILGMTYNEINKKFDEIVYFSEVERFLDTPVKRYSSGMYVRLAFSVAAHIEPDILVIDEVLAVGDSNFQKKCLGKMDDVSKQGRTVLFVSHSMPMVSNLCNRGIVLSSGKLMFSGPVSEAVIRYYESNTYTNPAHKLLHSSDNAELLSTRLSGSPTGFEYSIHQPVSISMSYRLKHKLNAKCVPNFHFYSANGELAFISNANDVIHMPAGDYVANCTIPGGLLNEGVYFVGVALTTYPDSGSYIVEFWDRNALTFNIVDPLDERSNRYNISGPLPGVVRPRLEWNIEKL